MNYKDQIIKSMNMQNRIEIIDSNSNRTIICSTIKQDNWKNEKEKGEEYTFPKNFPGQFNIRIDEVLGRE